MALKFWRITRLRFAIQKKLGIRQLIRVVNDVTKMLTVCLRVTEVQYLNDKTKKAFSNI